MKTNSALLLAGVLAGCGGEALEVKQPLPLDQVPAEILKVAQDRYPDLKFSAAWTEVEDGQNVYELKGQYSNGKMLEVEVTTDGQLLE
jgi:hypothetical protein